MMNEEQVEDFGGLDSSMTWTDGVEAGAEGHSVPQASPGEDPAAASALAQMEGTH
jgi:hypothetical protein